MANQVTKFEVYTFSRYGDMKCVKNAQSGVWIGVVREGDPEGHPRSSAMSPFDKAYMISYLSLIDIMHLSCTVFLGGELFWLHMHCWPLNIHYETVRCNIHRPEIPGACELSVSAVGIGTEQARCKVNGIGVWSMEWEVTEWGKSGRHGLQ